MVSTRSKPEPNQTVLEDFTGVSKTETTTQPQEKRRHDKVEKTRAHTEKRIKTEDTDEHRNDIKKEATTEETEVSKDDKTEKEEQSESEAQKSTRPDSPRIKREEAKEQEKEKEDEKEKESVIELKKSDDTDTHSEPIKINRAPVLTLFAACAAQFQYPNVPWPQCLSLGSAISSMCAISKGRAIGQIPQSSSDNHDDEKSRHERYVSVLGFQVPIKDGAAYVGDTKKGPNEGYLKSKFGERYAEVKNVMTEAMKSWKGHEEEFEKKGFHMYEKFRPGSGGWGQVGGLHVEEITRTITRP